MSLLEAQELASRLVGRTLTTARGRVVGAAGTSIRASLPGSALGDVVTIEADGHALLAEVIGFTGADVMLMPLASTAGVRPGDQVERAGGRRTIVAGPDVLGRVLDPLGAPMDGGAALTGESWASLRPSPHPLARRSIKDPVETGVRVIDGLFTIGYGQRIGIFAGPGVGKTTLLSRLAAAPGFDVVIAALVGERGREVRALVDALASDRSAIVVATADAPAPARIASVHTATALAEYFRAQGANVLLCVDSLTRFARAHRDVGLAAGEPPLRQGFPPSLSDALAGLIERAGNDANGTLTAVYTVLGELGERADPVADEAAALLDGHLVLSPELAARGMLPAVDTRLSLSRAMNEIVPAGHRAAAARLRQLVDIRLRRASLVNVGGYRAGQDPDLDEALELWPEILEFLGQADGARSTLAATRDWLSDLADIDASAETSS